MMTLFSVLYTQTVYVCDGSGEQLHRLAAATCVVTGGDHKVTDYTGYLQVNYS